MVRDEKETTRSDENSTMGYRHKFHSISEHQSINLETINNMLSTLLACRCRIPPHLSRRLLNPPPSPLTIKRHHQSSSSSSSSNSSSSNYNQLLRKYYDEYKWMPSVFGRFAACYATFYIVSEYGFDVTLCEGPSMLPTILRYNDIILYDRMSPRRLGMEGGCSGTDRAKAARARQEEFETKKQQLSTITTPKDDDDDDDDYYYQWHEPMIAVNELPTAGTWSRFWNQVTTGISVGDVVVVQHPDRRGTVCKRVLGLPGDLVVKPPASMRKRRHANNRRNNQGAGLLVIPDGHIWIEGDNTMNSKDSRDYGPIPAALIVGRVLCRVWPLRGAAVMQRGARPRISGAPCSGSTILPAGYEGEEIVKVYADAVAKQNKRDRINRVGQTW